MLVNLIVTTLIYYYLSLVYVETRYYRDASELHKKLRRLNTLTKQIAVIYTIANIWLFGPIGVVGCLFGASISGIYLAIWVTD